MSAGATFAVRVSAFATGADFGIVGTAGGVYAGGVGSGTALDGAAG